MKPFPFMTACTVLAQALTISLFSDATASSSQQTNPPGTQTNIQGRLQPISASASVDEGWFFDASFLYWNAKADGFNFVHKIKLDGINPNGAPTHLKASTRPHSPKFNEWDPGVQVGLGYIFPQREQWCTRLSWTHLNTDSEGSASSNINNIPNEYLAPILIPFVIGTVADHASGHWSLHYNILDLELSRQFYVGKWLSVKPRLGLRAAWIDQDFHAKYHAFFITNAGSFPFHTRFKCKQEFSGIGAKLGSDLQFYMTKAWSILGNLSTSLLWGSTELKEKTNGRVFADSTNSFPETIKLKQTIDKLRANLEGQLGLQWQTYYHQGKYRFATSALYTFSYWFNQNQLTNQVVGFPPTIDLSFPALEETTAFGDLQLQGLNIQFEFDF